jgi:hypothetical protein
VSLALLALTLVAAAAGSCPLAAGKWRELRTAHFVLATDLPADAADELAEQLEVLLGADLVVLGALRPEVPETLRVVAFADVETFRAFVPPPHDGVFVGGGGGVILLRGDLGRVTRASIGAHELMHYLLGRAIPRHPAWLAEGLATFVEGAGEGAAGETLRLGAATPERVWASRTDRAPLGEVLAAPRGPFTAPQYATSWLLVHFLRAKHAERLVAYERRLARGEDPGAAWVAAFPEWDPARPAALDALDRALTRYVRDDGEYVEERWIGRGEGAFRVAELTPADVRALCRALPRPGTTPSSRTR